MIRTNRINGKESQKRTTIVKIILSITYNYLPYYRNSNKIRSSSAGSSKSRGSSIDSSKSRHKNSRSKYRRRPSHSRSRSHSKNSESVNSSSSKSRNNSYNSVGGANNKSYPLNIMMFINKESISLLTNNNNESLKKV